MSHKHGKHTLSKKCWNYVDFPHTLRFYMNTLRFYMNHCLCLYVPASRKKDLDQNVIFWVCPGHCQQLLVHSINWYSFLPYTTRKYGGFIWLCNILHSNTDIITTVTPSWHRLICDCIFHATQCSKMKSCKENNENHSVEILFKCQFSRIQLMPYSWYISFCQLFRKMCN